MAIIYAPHEGEQQELRPSFTLARMQHPAITGIHRTVGIAFAVVGAVLIVFSTNAASGGPNLAPVVTAIGFFLLALSLIYFAVHALGTLLYHQELMRSKLRDPAPDSDSA